MAFMQLQHPEPDCRRMDRHCLGPLSAQCDPFSFSTTRTTSRSLLTRLSMLLLWLLVRRNHKLKQYLQRTNAFIKRYQSIAKHRKKTQHFRE
jgi:hypothetical protein